MTIGEVSVPMEPQENETWECEVCGYINENFENVCAQCGSLRSEPSYDQISDEEDEES